MVDVDSPTESILIVEDDEAVRTLLQPILQDAGYPCATAESSEKALDYLKSNACRLMLVDIHLPGMSGLDLLQICRRQWPDTQVVMCSGDNTAPSPSPLQTSRLATKWGVAIIDDGCGIAAEHLDKIFEPFYTTKLETGGTGLGVLILQEIIAQHQGCIQVQSKPGSGSTFMVTLPVFSA